MPLEKQPTLHFTSAVPLMPCTTRHSALCTLGVHGVFAINLIQMLLIPSGLSPAPPSP